MRIASLGIALISAVLSGCTVLPTVQYKPINGPDDMVGMTDSFYLQRSELEVSIGSAGEVTVTSTPREMKATKIGLKAVTNWRSSTVVTVSKTANTDLVSSIGVEVTDTTAKSISTYGGLIAKAISTLDQPIAKGKDDCPAPGTKTLVQLELPISSGTRSIGNCIEMTIYDRPLDAMEVAKIPAAVNTHNFYYASCRDVEIRTVGKGGASLPKRVRIADPGYVQFVQFPPKGSITSHTECGVSVKTDAAATDNTAAVIDALLTQLKAIQDAQNKK